MERFENCGIGVLFEKFDVLPDEIARLFEYGLVGSQFQQSATVEFYLIRSRIKEKWPRVVYIKRQKQRRFDCRGCPNEHMAGS